MKDQLSEKERKLYEQGLNNVAILRTRSDITRILFMVVINLVLAIGTTIFPMKISIALVMIISLVFYFIDLPMRMRLIFSGHTIVMYVIVMTILYCLDENFLFIRVIKIITNVYFCTTLSNKLDMTKRYCKHMLRR